MTSLNHVIGSIEPNPKAFDPARREIERQRRADGENIATRPGEHVVDFRLDRTGHLARPRLE